jgi:hypothetical protein
LLRDPMNFLRCYWLGLMFVLGASTVRAQEKMTPVLLAVKDAPVPFMGSDGKTHLVYELWMSNFSSGEAAVEKVEVVGDGAVIETLEKNAVGERLQLAGQRKSSSVIAGGATALLFVHVVLAEGTAAPAKLSHRVMIRASAAPPGQQEIQESGGEVEVSRAAVVRIGPPLSGVGYISADSCCDAVRHTRAALPMNGRVWLAQRYAVDWEELNGEGRIYSGPQDKLESYGIFGKPVLAVADAVVERAVDGETEQVPGKYPTNISPSKADGNHVILNLGGGRYALYAHLQTGSVKVRKGDKVRAGQVLGLVGDSGNSLAPHLHFQVMDGASSLASNGLPYEITEFEVTGETGGTEMFDEAEAKGTPLAVTVVSPARRVKDALPLDQLIISFAGDATGR